MKNEIRLIAVILILSLFSCIPPMKSITGIEPGQEPYSSIAIISNIDPSIEKPCMWFHDAISSKIEKRGATVYKHIIVAENKALQLNADDSNSVLVEKLKSERPELLITITPTYKLYEDRALSRVDYQAVGVDTSKEKEVWKATFSLYRQLLSGAHKSAETVSEKLYVQMIKDGVI